MKWSHCGTELPKFFLDKNNILLLLIFGLLVAFMQKWLKEKHYLLGTQKLIRYSRFSKHKEHLMKIIGQQLLNCQTSNQLSLNGKAFHFLNMYKTLMNMDLIYWLVWLHLNHTKEFLAEWQCNIHTLMISIRVKL